MTKSNGKVAAANKSNSRNSSAHETGVSMATIQLQVTNPYKIACFEDFMSEASRLLNVEMNAKNRAYYFILNQGLYGKYVEFCREQHSDDLHTDCIEYLTSKI